MDLRIPKLREGSYFPSILEPRKKAEKALTAVLQEAYVLGVSTLEVSRTCEGLDELGPAEDGAFWLGFLRSLLARGLRGVQLIISDAHVGLRRAIPAVFAGATWQHRWRSGTQGP